MSNSHCPSTPLAQLTLTHCAFCGTATCPHDCMTVALNRPFVADLRQPGVTGRRCGPTIVEMIGADDKPQALPPYSGPPPPQMHHRIPPEAAHGLVNAPGAYDQPWRPYPPSFEHHHAEQRRASNPPQPSLPPHGYPVIPNRELPQLPPEGPYGRPNSLPAPSLTPTESHAPTFRPMNGASHDSIPHSAPTHPGPPPHSAPSEFRPRMTYPPQEQSSNGETPPAPPPAPHTMPPAQFPTPIPHISHTPAPYEPNYYQNQAFGMRQRKAARAQQVITVFFSNWRRGNKLTFIFFPLSKRPAISVEQEKPSVMKGGLPAAIARRTI